jgi:hypothetical protein
MNKHNLARDIPDAVKREIRQACYHGCVICGKLPYTYEHFDPPFEDATAHNPNGMALLCGNHQLDRTAGRLSVEDVRQARNNPFNKTNDAVWPSHFTDTKMALNLFGNIIQGPSVGFAINDQVVFGMKAPEQAGGAWQFTGSFCDPSGSQTLRFEDNEIITNNGAWDVTMEGNNLIVRSGPRSIVAHLSFRPEQNWVELNRVEMRLANNHYLKGTPTGISIHGPQLNLDITGISGSYQTGSAFSYGQATTGQFSTIAVKDPCLGTLNDWMIKT